MQRALILQVHYALAGATGFEALRTPDGAGELDAAQLTKEAAALAAGSGSAFGGVIEAGRIADSSGHFRSRRYGGRRE
jgi:hypothetical protein